MMTFIEIRNQNRCPLAYNLRLTTGWVKLMNIQSCQTGQVLLSPANKCFFFSMLSSEYWYFRVYIKSRTY